MFVDIPNDIANIIEHSLPCTPKVQIHGKNCFKFLQELE